MFLYQSNRLENLFAHWRAVVARPLADPLAPEIVVVHNQGMAQWLARQTALAEGIAANLHFPLPGRFFWDLLHQLTDSPHQEDLFERPILLWRISRLLPRFLDTPAFTELDTYLRDDDDGRKRHQLASRIADLFDQYMVYRPDLLARWLRPILNEGWQATLWRALTESGAPIRAQLAERFRDLLGGDDALDLPHRIHFFGVNALAPAYVDILFRLSGHSEIHLFHLSPCRQYWSELVSARRLAGLRLRQNPPEPPWPDYYDQGHPLLASLGRTGQDFSRQLLDGDPVTVDLHQDSNRPGVLAALQNDILDLHDRGASDQAPFPLDGEDRSIQFHICFSRLREIQVLQDRLLDLFQSLPDLTPADILVTAPDIQHYAAAIAGVFGETAPGRRIPWSIADQSARQELPAVRCFLDLIALLGGRFTAPEVLALCEHDVLLARFGLEPACLTRLHEWVQEAGIRWGLDQNHREQLEVRADGRHSWRFGLDRLLLGHLMGDCQEPFLGVLPYPNLASGETETLSAFLDLIATLARWQGRMRGRRAATDWETLLLSLLNDCFPAEAAEQGLALLRETVHELAASCSAAGFTEGIPVETIRLHLETALSGREGGQPFLSGRVTFCNMVPMRSVPFRVIWLLGMNDADFPRSQHPPAFDLMARQPRLGDRNRRNDDRYLFLEALLSAREVLAISWVGRSLRDESISPPSTVVCELQDTLNSGWIGPSAKASEHLTTHHPMQPFSRRCFDGTLATASYNPSWLPASTEREPSPFLPAPLPASGEPERRIDIHQLVRFWDNPIRYLLERTLGLHLRDERYGLEASEPFTLGQLERYHLRRDAITSLLAGAEPEQVFAQLSSSGRLPAASFAQVHFDDLAKTAADFATRLHPLLTAAWPPIEVDLSIAGDRLTGRIGNLCQAGRFDWGSSQRRTGQIMALWIQHLLLHLSAPGHLPRRSTLVTKGGSKEMAAVEFRLGPVADADSQLRALIEGYRQGLTSPLPLFPRTSLAWARATPENAMAAARSAWNGSFSLEGEGQAPEFRLLFGRTDPFDDSFLAWAGLLRLVLDHNEAADATA